jgi:autotransporter-associated beta strand protein
LTLSGANTYTEGTIIMRGALLVDNPDASATSSEPVEVRGGSLDGNGIIAGTVTMGLGNRAALLAPGIGSTLGTLAIQSSLLFNSAANYQVELDSASFTADQVVANGITISSGATVTVADLGAGTLTDGTAFAMINNTAATPIAGSFDNLPDGSTLTIGNNTFQADYQGGDGNDLTLTVQ